MKRKIISKGIFLRLVETAYAFASNAEDIFRKNVKAYIYNLN